MTEDGDVLKIKKCPFCAARNTLLDTFRVSTSQEAHIEYAVICMNCGAHGPNAMSREGAYAMWEMRRDETVAEV